MSNELRLKDYFLFTQNSLATYEKCPLKFKKRYLENLKWDSFPDERVKVSLERGNNFHVAAHRYFMMIDTGLDDDSEEFGELNDWLESLVKDFQIDNKKRYLPEYKLRMSKGDLKLEANFDLLIVEDNRIQIWDWKTHSSQTKEKRIKQINRLNQSLQTIVYLYVLGAQSHLIGGKEIPLENITMNYWQPQYPNHLTKIDYSEELHKTFERKLKKLIKEIHNFDYSTFDKNKYIKQCKFCEFNWFCNNEKVNFEEIVNQDNYIDELDLDEIEEIF